MLTKELIRKMVQEDINALLRILEKNIKHANDNLLLIEKGEMTAEYMEEEIEVINESQSMVNLIQEVINERS